MKYTKFEDLRHQLNSQIDYQVAILEHMGGQHVGMKLECNQFPLSINEAEFNYMHNFILEHKLTTGFELSTGTGISSIAIATAFKETGGHLITVDSHFEELKGIHHNIVPVVYEEKDYEDVKTRSNCYKFFQKAIKVMDIADQVDVVIGWSPTDTVKAIQARGNLLDFVFLDCPKSDDEFERDMSSIEPYLNKDKYVVFVHDTHCYTTRTDEYVMKLLGKPLARIHEYFHDTEFYSKRHFPLGIITNIR